MFGDENHRIRVTATFEVAVEDVSPHIVDAQKADLAERVSNALWSVQGVQGPVRLAMEHSLIGEGTVSIPSAPGS